MLWIYARYKYLIISVRGIVCRRQIRAYKDGQHTERVHYDTLVPGMEYYRIEYIFHNMLPLG